MRSSRHTALALVGAWIAAALATASLQAAQDRPLFQPGTAPVSATAASAPRTGGTLAPGGERSALSELVPTGIALGATLLVIVLARSAVKRFSGSSVAGKRPQGVVEVLARYPVARGQQVVLLKVGRRVIVAHQGAQAMQTLSEFTGEAEVADILARCEAGNRAASPFSFDALLRQSSAAPARGGSREHLPAGVRDADIETVDLTRRRRGTGGA